MVLFRKRDCFFAFSKGSELIFSEFNFARCVTLGRIKFGLKLSDGGLGFAEFRAVNGREEITRFYHFAFVFPNIPNETA